MSVLVEGNYSVMIDRATFYRRLEQNCKKCDFWKGACLKGHALSSPQGCPIKKFPPVQGADYAPDRNVRPAPEVPMPGNCCGSDADLKPMNWSQAASHLTASLATWARDGFKTTPDDVYNERVGTCQDNCPSYKWFQCRMCKCLVFTKAKIPSERCPAERWKR